MPTGYTADLLEGKIDTKEYAHLCLRAMGVSIRQRDEPLSAATKKIEVDDYYIRNVEEAKKEINRIENLSDEEIQNSFFDYAEKAKKRNIETIEKRKIQEKNLRESLKKINSLVFPTSEFSEYKKFMIEQIEKTIDFDCGYSYYENDIASMDEKIRNFDVHKERQTMLNVAKDRLKRENERLKKEQEMVKKQNEWLETALEVINTLN